jgi:hypothetical protein
MGDALVRGAARTAGSGSPDRGVAAPTFGSVLARGLPGFLREGFLPLAAFYAAWRLSGTAAGIGAAAAVSLGLYLYERRAGRDGVLVRLALAFVVVQTAAGLISGSATVYLAAPVVANAVWAAAFLGSAAIGRPLAGALARAWYPFTPEFRRTAEFRRVYGVESVVWGLYLLARCALRLLALLHGGVGDFVVVSFLTGTPATLALVAWSIWYSIRGLSDDSPDPSASATRRAPGLDVGEKLPPLVDVGLDRVDLPLRQVAEAPLAAEELAHGQRALRPEGDPPFPVVALEQGEVP